MPIFMRAAIALTVLAMVLVAPAAQAFTLTLSKQQLNVMVRAVFPQQRTFDNIEFTFSDPQVDLDPLEDELMVLVTVLAVQNGQRLRATAEIAGQVSYHGQLAQLQIKQPRLDKLTIDDNQAMVADSLITGIKRLEGKRMPLILLVDFAQLDLAAWGLSTPRRIEITSQGLLIEI
ncbi:hypothetical protein [Alteromonas gilva]|uniref:DUF1439 domain-containing protein n=1 Tax=Alteromonas gilva TaxID=2987522 RepID=A0ABT5KXW4_9ALTE|nr:hypothetical protein [Alteromonas gilva]MDC8829591.1 hypothetical protein [Alteromonas gilva]